MGVRLVKRIGKFFFYIVLFLALAVFFSPKRQLYYLAESKLQPYGVVLSGEYVDDRGYGLVLSGGTLYYEDLEVAHLGDLTILPLLVYNRIGVTSLTPSDEMRKFLPGTVDEITVRQSVTDPLKVYLQASGGFGRLKGEFDLLSRHLRVSLTPAKALVSSGAAWLREFKKQASGEYLYESTF